MKRRSLHFWVALVVLLFWRVPYLSAESYRWVDSSGIVHYSPVRNMIISSAGRLSVDPALVEAIVAVESAFDPRALSPKGAMGLMQLMPQTASRYGVSDPFDPQENLTGGIRYLRDLLRLFDGDLPQVLAAYNAGENAVLRYRGLPPYRETRDYVRKVLARYQPDPASVPFPFVVRQRDTSSTSRGIISVSGTRTKSSTSYRPLTRLSPRPLVRMRGSRPVLVQLRVRRYRGTRAIPTTGSIPFSSAPAE
ncbi:MAG: lytic transglycosylase domain-containing protein [Candidatus Binatia bacterium]